MSIISNIDKVIRSEPNIDNVGYLKNKIAYQDDIKNNIVKIDWLKIIDAPPTDGLWDDGRTDEGQLGFNYNELEDAMKNPDSPHRAEYEKIRKQNLHKMDPIPVCKIPS